MFYFLLALCDRPDLDRKLWKEIQEEESSVSSVSSMMLQNGLKESMRYKPVGPVIMRCAIQDDIYDGIEIKAGTNIVINLVDMHRRQDQFRKPNEFSLDNVDDKEWSNINTDRNVFVPFGAGPKECVGRWLAKVEMEVIISKMIQQYSFKRANGTKTLEDLDTRWDIAQQPTDPGYMFFHRRDQQIIN